MRKQRHFCFGGLIERKGRVALTFCMMLQWEEMATSWEESFTLDMLENEVMSWQKPICIGQQCCHFGAGNF